MLNSGIVELEKSGFLKELSADERFVRKARGEWSVVFLKASKTAAIERETSSVVKELIERGISAGSARKIASSHTEEKIREKLSLFDWLSARKDIRVQKNPAGFLYRAITDDFSPR